MARGRPPDIEKRRTAFDEYRRTGNQTRAAEAVGVAVSIVHSWKKEEDWDQKIKNGQEKFKSLLASVEKTDDNTVLQQRLKEKAILDGLEVLIYEAIYTGGIIPKTFNDVVLGSKYISDQRRLLLGEPTSRTETKISIMVASLSNDELDSSIKKIQGAIACSVAGEVEEAGSD